VENRSPMLPRNFALLITRACSTEFLYLRNSRAKIEFQRPFQAPGLSERNRLVTRLKIQDFPARMKRHRSMIYSNSLQPSGKIAKSRYLVDVFAGCRSIIGVNTRSSGRRGPLLVKTNCLKHEVRSSTSFRCIGLHLCRIASGYRYLVANSFRY